MSDYMKNSVSVETYEAGNGMTPKQVINEIKQGDKIKGTYYRDHWFATGKVLVSLVVANMHNESLTAKVALMAELRQVGEK